MEEGLCKMFPDILFNDATLGDQGVGDGQRDCVLTLRSSVSGYVFPQDGEGVLKDVPSHPLQ